MLGRLYALFAAALVVLPRVGSAEDLLNIYDLALQNDPGIREAEQRYFANNEARPQALALMLPNLSVGGNVEYVNEKTRSQLRGDYRDSFEQNRLTASVQQPVFRRNLWYGLKQADNVLAQGEAQYRSAEIELMVRTTNAYFNVLKAADNVRVTTAELKANERQLEQSKQRFDVGLVAITDVNESQAAFDRARANLIIAENQLGNAWEALRQIIGSANMPLAKLGEKLDLMPPAPADIEQWTETALNQNYGIIAAREAAEAAKQNVEIQRSGHYPSLDLVGSYGALRSGGEFIGDDNTGIIGLQLTVPLYEGGGVSSRTRQAEHEYQAALEALDTVRREVLRNVKDAYRGVLASISEVKARKSALVSARSALDSTEAGLEVGTRTQVDVLNAQQRYFQEERFYLLARYEYILNGVRLNQAASTLTRDKLAVGNSWLVASDSVPPPGGMRAAEPAAVPIPAPEPQPAPKRPKRSR